MYSVAATVPPAVDVQIEAGDVSTQNQKKSASNQCPMLSIRDACHVRKRFPYFLRRAREDHLLVRPLVRIPVRTATTAVSPV